MRALILTLLVALPVAAQVFLPARRIVPTGSAYYNPTNWLPTPEYWWNSTDLSSSPVETWTDRVRGRNMKQTTGSLKPFWSTNGVYFDGFNDYLVVTNVISTDLVCATDRGTWMFVLGMVDPSRVVPQLLIGDGTSASDYFVFGKTNWLGDSSGTPATDLGPVSTNYFYLFLTTSNNTTEAFGFTNGVLAYGPAPWNSGADVTRVGNSTDTDPGGNPWPYAGYVQEIIGWTNVFFTASQLSNVNKYATSVWTIGSPAPSPSPYPAQAAIFDGVTDYTRLTSSGPTGLADGKAATVSCWLNFSGGDGAQTYIFTIGPVSGRFYLYKTAGDKISLFARNAAAGTILDIAGSTSITSASGWVHVYACVDLANAANRKIYINGVAEALTVTTYSNDTIDYVGVNYTYTAGTDSGAPPVTFMPGSMAELWWDDTYLDDVSLFASGGCPIFLGYSGAVPTGSSPVFYFRGSGPGFNVNYGTGGDFTTTGALTVPTPPCQ